MAQGVFCFLALQQRDSGNETTLREGMYVSAMLFSLLSCYAEELRLPGSPWRER